MSNSLRWPTLSMSMRLLAVLVASLLISQGLTTLLFLNERSAFVRSSAVREATSRAAELILVLDTLDEDARQRSMQALSAASTRAARKPLAPVDEEFRVAVARQLRAALPGVSELDVLRPDPARAVDFVLDDDSGVPDSGKTTEFDVMVTLHDARHAALRVSVPPQVAPPLRLVLAYLVTLIVSLCVGSYLLSRSMSRRLRRLAAAADAVGRGLQAAPLSESGPPELRKAARAFNLMQERLRRYLDSRTRVLTAMSHDLRTPITRLRLRAASVENRELQDKMVGDLDQIALMVQESLESLQGLESTEAIQPVRVESLVEALQSEYEELGFPLASESDLHDAVPARPQALRRALTNLIDNARRFATSASLRVEKVGDECVFTLSDNGPGIPASELVRVLEPFYRLESSRNRGTGGAGLGLSIARDIAHAHGGELTLSNLPEGGLIARLTLHIGA
jgi:signal transduction histidine kinase